MYTKHPKIAKRWSRDYPQKKLPDRNSGRSKMHKRVKRARKRLGYQRRGH